VYDDASMKLNGPSAKLNFPMDGCGKPSAARAVSIYGFSASCAYAEMLTCITAALMHLHHALTCVSHCFHFRAPSCGATCSELPS